MTVNRLRMRWSGFPGAPGVSTFYFTAATDPGPTLRTMMNSLVALFSSNVKIDIDAGGDTIDELTGHINGAWTGTSVAQVVGTATDAPAGPAGVCINWLTSVVVAGRRVQGRTFLVPVTVGHYDFDGTLTAATLTSVNAAVTTWRASAGGLAQKILTKPKPPAAGASSAVTGFRVPDKVVVLRSRRP
jgi:hypothetical protein